MARNLSINIEILLGGIGQFKKFADELNRVKAAGTANATALAQTGARISDLSKHQDGARNSALAFARALATLQKAEGSTATATETLARALSGVERNSIPALRAMTQFANLSRSSLAQSQRSLDAFSQSLVSVGNKLSTGVSLPLAGFAGLAIRTATQFDSLQRGLIAVSGSADAANKQFERLKEVAKLPGLGFKEAIQGSINHQAAG